MREMAASTTASATPESVPAAPPVTLADVQAAAKRIAGAVVRTPCHHSPALSRLCGCDVYAKLDYLQATGSFKERGARNKLLTLDEEARGRGVIANTPGKRKWISKMVFLTRLINSVWLTGDSQFGEQFLNALRFGLS